MTFWLVMSCWNLTEELAGQGVAKNSFPEAGSMGDVNAGRGSKQGSYFYCLNSWKSLFS